MPNFRKLLQLEYTSVVPLTFPAFEIKSTLSMQKLSRKMTLYDYFILFDS